MPTVHVRLDFTVSKSPLVPLNSMICPRNGPKRRQKAPKPNPYQRILPGMHATLHTTSPACLSVVLLATRLPSRADREPQTPVGVVQWSRMEVPGFAEHFPAGITNMWQSHLGEMSRHSHIDPEGINSANPSFQKWEEEAEELLLLVTGPRVLRCLQVLNPSPLIPISELGLAEDY